MLCQMDLVASATRYNVCTCRKGVLPCEYASFLLTDAAPHAQIIDTFLAFAWTLSSSKTGQKHGTATTMFELQISSNVFLENLFFLPDVSHIIFLMVVPVPVIQGHFHKTPSK